MEFLNETRSRATYDAVGQAIGVSSRSVAELLGGRRPSASWVVAKRTGEPTGYGPNETHPDLKINAEVIQTSEELIRRMKRWEPKSRT
jgi:hypothetical protein